MTSFLGCGLPILRNRIYWRLPRPQLAAAGSSLCNDVIPRLRAADPYGIEFAGDYLDHNRQLQGRFSVITSFLGAGCRSYGIEFAGDYLDHNRQLQGRFSVITSFLGCGLPIPPGSNLLAIPSPTIGSCRLLAFL